MIILQGSKNPGRHSNWLFSTMLMVSVLIHGVLILQVAGMNSIKPLTVIEMIIHEEPGPKVRLIPQPRVSARIPKANDVPRPQVDVPRFKIEPEDTPATDEIAEPVAPIVQEEKAEDSPEPLPPESNGLLSKNGYYDMIRTKIEAAKIYPESARRWMIEGKVTVQFTVALDGQVASVAVAISSGNRQLDQAAVRAVSNAGPFERPPGTLFKGPLKMEIIIAFVLT